MAMLPRIEGKFLGGMVVKYLMTMTMNREAHNTKQQVPPYAATYRRAPEGCTPFTLWCMRSLNVVVLLIGVIWFASLVGCSLADSHQTLFHQIPSIQSGIQFTNTVTSTDSLNIYSYNNFYAGGGVALADYDGDGQLDIYLVSNQGPNRLYLNRGDFVFEDVTETAGVAGSFPWATGASVVDINADGVPDLYVANAGASRADLRRNELFVNNGDGTFTERAQEYGLADEGYSIHAVFFDYDQDGFLDVYVVNNFPAKPITAYNLEQMDRTRPYFEGGDRLYRNEGGKFVEMTAVAGMFSSEAGFSLGASAGDLNRDGCMDLYVSNDFFERDYLYINQCDGTFNESLEASFASISTTSMGGDIADLNNDGAPEIFISDMLPATTQRIKRVANFIEWEKYQEEIRLGYHRKFLRNTLHYNNADGSFSEIGRYAGVDATDWSWAGLLADFNLDGLRDIFVPNGFYKDVTDKDLLMASSRVAASGFGGPESVQNLVNMMPSTSVSNHIFENVGALRFKDRTSTWGFDTPGFSSGAAYGDLDGDGDLDIVVNNVNMEAFVYRNHATEYYPDRSWIQIELQGDTRNPHGVGAQVEAIHHGERWYVEQMPQRGFQSSVDPVLHLGLGTGVNVLDTILVRWPDGRFTIQEQTETRQRITLRKEQAFSSGPVHASGSFSEVQISDTGIPFWTNQGINTPPLLEEVTDKTDLEWRHIERPYNDFQHSPLLFHMRSTEGPPLCGTDINGDGRDDLYIGGGKGQPGILLMHELDGHLRETRQPVLEQDRESEDVDCVWVDIDGDGHSELYVASGSSEVSSGQPDLADRLYTLSEEGILQAFEHELPNTSYRYSPTGVVRPTDVDGDGDQDLFIGIRQGDVYGQPVGGMLLENDGTGRFRDVTERVIPAVRASEFRTGGITDAEWGDLNGDGSHDLVVVGEWIPLTIFLNEDGILRPVQQDEAGLSGTSGWWQAIDLADLNGDGATDIVAGNHGLNSRFRATRDEPLEMWVHDFNRDDRLDQIVTGHDVAGGPWPFAQREQLLLNFGLAPFIARSHMGLGSEELEWIFQQMPHLSPLADPFESYAQKTVYELFGAELGKATHYVAEQMQTVIAWNRQDGSFDVEPLPFRAQWAPMYAILAEDFDGDETPEIMMGGNLHAAVPQAGRYDAGYGVVLRMDSTGRFIDLPAAESGFWGEGEIRDIERLKSGEEILIAVSYSGRALDIFRPARRTQE